MQGLLRNIVRPLPRLARWYLSRKRSYHYGGLSIDVLPGVFHPGLFFSTGILLKYIQKQTIHGSLVLEIGAGTGIISLLAAKSGARVTATDITELAIRNIQLNAEKNELPITVIQSDVFENLAPTQFDWIIVNPPYYAKKPKRDEEFAWYCGESHEYFVKFFDRLKMFVGPGTRTIMVLSDVCDLPSIFKIGSQHHFEFIKLSEKYIWADGKNYVFQIRPAG